MLSETTVAPQKVEEVPASMQAPITDPVIEEQPVIVQTVVEVVKMADPVAAV